MLFRSGSYGGDPATYLRRLRDEMEASLDERDELVGRKPGGEAQADRA